MKKLHKIKKLKLMSLRDWNVFRFPIWGKRLFESCSSSMDLSFGMCSSLEKASGVTSGAAILSRDIRVREWLSRVSPDLGKGFPNISRPRAWLSRTFPDLGNGFPEPFPTSGMAFPILSRPREWLSRSSLDLGDGLPELLPTSGERGAFLERARRMRHVVLLRYVLLPRYVQAPARGAAVYGNTPCPFLGRLFLGV
jgi:hypothetical protein